MVNDCMSHALVDTSSGVSLAKSSFIDSLGLECHQMRNLPRLAGITQNILPVRGTVYLGFISVAGWLPIYFQLYQMVIWILTYY